MNKSIKTLSLALLLCVPGVYGMKNNIVISAPSEPFTITEPFIMHDIVIPNDIIGNFFKYACLGNNTNIVYEIKTMGELFRSVCKHWHNRFQPTSIRTLFNLTPERILETLMIIAADKYTYDRYASVPFEDINVEKKENHPCIKFIADMLKDQPESYNKILKSAIKRCDLFTVKTILENGANPNSNVKDLYLESYDTPLSLAIHELTHFSCPDYALANKNRQTIFELLLKHGGHIHQACGDGQTIMDIASTHCKHNPFMLESIIKEKGSIHPGYQEQIDELLAMKKELKFYGLATLAVGIPVAIAFVYNVYTGAIHF